ncbi:MAG: LysM peptidoglycan-binding domain-containing protein [Bdellovibrionales bacterium]|nr:LysM peptidoglycan-binding domain-containing protein [Bdellovibrionales bacterium]
MKSYRSAIVMRTFMFVALCYLSSCASRIEEFPSLVGQGILALSPSNPYQGANAFVSRELEKSAQLRGFFRTRGAPEAIEVREPRFERPELYLFYPQEQIVYKAELQQSDTVHDWIVLGPYGISRQDYLTLRRISRSVKGDPVFLVFGKQLRFPVKREMVVARKIEPVIPLPPTPTPTPEPEIEPEELPKTSEPVAEKPKPTPSEFANPAFVPRGLDELALMEAQGFARKDFNGDILHIVKSIKENLEDISKWYTGSSENVGQIREINQITSKDPLALGQTIRIPAEFVVETKRYQMRRTPSQSSPTSESSMRTDPTALTVP